MALEEDRLDLGLGLVRGFDPRWRAARASSPVLRGRGGGFEWMGCRCVLGLGAL